MRYNRPGASNDWRLTEITKGEWRPFSDAFANANLKDLVAIAHELVLLRAAGVPPDKCKGNPEIQAWTGKCRSAHHKTTFYVLKAKPSGWRLYCCIPDPVSREILFLYAVNKKRQDRNPEDFEHLCRLREKLDAGVLGVADLYIPTR